jgi:N-acetylglucosaminyldiphosphoundecaprenol N-acetyl-beta-D-mannosaminyltransferase
MLQPTEDLSPASVHGLKVSLFDDAELRDYFDRCIRGRGQAVCYGYSLTLLPRFRQMPQIHTISETFQVMVADGKGLHWLCRLLGVPVRSDATITDAMYMLFGLAAARGFRVMLLGTDAEGNRRATENVRREYPGAVVLDGRDGYFTVEQEPDVVAEINAKAPDILMIGISSPKKEEFVARHRGHLDVPVIVPFGGNIDILSGRTRPIPLWIKRAGVTWLYRILQEPRRLAGLIGGNAADVVFRLMPRLLWQHFVCRDAGFSIADFYKAGPRPPGAASP